jgi:acyl transferase domain-containing protein/3-hydroxymyristoyl/3-hydroxydecanoyl-(acyl carrier protein) dehydratase
MSDRIAIVSVAGRFPGCGADLGKFWGSVAAAEDCSREVPAGRWVLPPNRCTDPRVAHPDTVYSTRGYYLDPFAPDLADLDLDLALVAQLDPLFQLVLDAGNRAFRDARTEKIDRSRVGVVLGNICLPTDGSSDLCREILGPKVGLPPGPGTHPLNRYVAGLPAGLLARGLRLGLGSYTLDAACASSLYAIKLAADELMAGRADAMLAGGCSRPDCQYTQMGFAQLRALSAAGRCRPFDAGADGLMVGEGAGVFVLKRLSDALKHGDTILATVAGVGLSNDMHGNLLAPAKEGQLRAMRRAYETAEWDPTHADLIECHATGTPVGDAIEFDSLRELWGDTGWKAGQCAIGSVKSTVGHLLTGAGAAALAKVLLAIKNETLPPQANFGTPASGLKYKGGPFRVLGKAEKWERRGASEPRRAAVSGFGFGGVNAHLLVEEWTGAPVPKPKQFATTPKALRVHESKWQPPGQSAAAVPVAVVGIGAHFGPSDTLLAFQERALSGDAPQPVPKLNGWRLASAASPPGFGIESLAVPIDRFRIPPKELEETLPQQLLMLQVAAAALDDCRAGVKLNAGDAPTTGVFVGLGLDPNTTNYHLRWAALSNPEGAPHAASPPLSANRVMGALGSIAASRIARTFHVGGPSHTVCSEEGSAARALELGVRAVQSGELDRAIVGGVDLACDPRMVLPGKVKNPGEGAAAFVLKRLDDAKRDGDRVYAVVRGVGTAADAKSARARAERDAGEPFDTAVRFDAARDVGEAGAASAAASLAKACVALNQEILTAPARYWLRDRDEKPRRALVTASGADGTHFAIMLEEHAKKPADVATSPEYAQPLGARNEGVFVVDGDSPQTLAAGLARLAEFVARVAPEASPAAVGRSSLDTPLTMTGPRPPRNVEAVAREWFRESPPNRVQPLAVTLVARSTGELHEQVAFAREALAADPTAPFPATAKPALRDRVFYAPQPLGPKGKVAFVFPGSGNQFDGMGRDLSAHWPAALRRQQAENECLRSQYAPDHFWTGRALEAPARELMFGQVTVGSLVSDIVASLGVRCDAMVGLSLGESAGLFGVRAWQGRDTMFRRMQQSTLFASDLAPPYDAARRYWGVPADEDVDWVIGVVGVPADDVLAVLRPGLRAYLLIVNTPTECVIGGVRADVEKLAVVLGKSVTALRGVTLAHCEAARPVEIPYRELHTLPVTAPAGVAVYSGAYGRAYKPTEKACADSITAGLLATIDVPAVVNAAYRDGVRAFVEVGPGNSCVRMIDAVLGDRPHLARAAHAARQDAASQILRLVAHLVAERFPVNFAALYGQESLCAGHQDRVASARKELVVPVGGAWAAVPPPPVPPELDPSTISTPMPTPIIVPTPQPVFVSTPAPAPIYDPAVYRPLAVDPLAVTPVARPREFAPAAAPTVAAQSPVAVHLPAATIHHAPASQRVTLSAATAAPAPVAMRHAPIGLAEAAANVQTLAMQAQESFLRVNRGYIETAGRIVQMQVQLAEALARTGRLPGVSFAPAPPPQVVPAAVTPPGDGVPRSLTYEQCCAFAAGRVADALGAKFAEVDTFPTRVRLPDGPLQLVDRITLIEGEPLSMTRGRVVTEHTVRADRWYLEAGRIPTAIAVEAGQADLFLSGYLGIDFQTRGLAVYRLLDAVVSFQRGLPQLGETVVYDIHIDEFVKQGDAWIFRFWFDGTINGEPFIRMRSGVAGFFTAAALAAGKGIVQTALDKRRIPGKRPSDWRDLVPQRECSLSAEQVDALRAGDLATAFGPAFAHLPLRTPATLPSGMLRLVDRVPLIDPLGGRFGIGFVRAEFDIHPDDWFLTCHFVDDMVMPGTLMYECCLHTLRVLLMRTGWVGEAGEVVCEPVPGVDSRLKCRGQVLSSTKTVTYEVTVKELGYADGSGTPFCIADSLMYADGKPIVEITNMTLRMSGLTREKLERYWASSSPRPRKAPLYDRAKILAYSNGNPSEGFGSPYAVFDEGQGRVIARLPGPPFQFLDCVTEVTGEPFEMKAGAACETEYQVPADAWYFRENRGERMPFAVLLEIALQPCGWLAAYCGSALTSPDDLSFRNLGGKGVQHRPVTPRTGLLTMNVKMTSVSRSAGMVIQHYDMKVRDAAGAVYEGTTYFGFFTKAALANQVGIRDAKVPLPAESELPLAETDRLPGTAPFPGSMLRMVDRIEAFLPRGGAAGLGLIVGKIAVDPGFWFFKAHFYQDPVWPGSLGLESFLQLLKYVAWKRWQTAPPGGFQTVAVNKPHSWVYRGQVLPTDKEVTVVLEVTAADDEHRRITANGFLTVDGRVIYQMTDFTLE